MLLVSSNSSFRPSRSCLGVQRTECTRKPGGEGEYQSSTLANLYVPYDRLSIDFQWFWIVTRHSALQFTFDEDRLPALAAMAQLVSKGRKDDEYIAGLWKSSILHGILWYTLNPQQSIGSPTWSWAAISSAVHWHFDLPSFEMVYFRGVAVAALQYDWIGLSHVGRVRDAHITLRARID
jgi:hypothetical protein